MNEHLKPDAPWVWDAQTHPNVMQVFAKTNWYDQLEKAASDAITGKVLCVCAAMAIAREVLANLSNVPQKAVDAIKLLDQWIDDPTDDRFGHICSIIFEDDTPDLDPFDAVWWALRTATSAVGCYEAGWALDTICEKAAKAGISQDKMRFTAESEVLARMRSGEALSGDGSV